MPNYLKIPQLHTKKCCSSKDVRLKYLFKMLHKKDPVQGIMTCKVKKDIVNLSFLRNKPLDIKLQLKVSRD